MSHKKKSLRNLRDVTIHDFANAKVATNRSKKHNNVPLDSWEQLSEEHELELINNNTQITITCSKTETKASGRIEVIRSEEGVLYPEMLFYLISRFVMPEDIGKFAAINHATYAITKTESFWKSLYRRYCANNRNLPKYLLLERSYRLYGLRARVVKSLYFCYNLFIHRIQCNIQSPHPLVKRKCISTWYHKQENDWIFYFKLKIIHMNIYRSQSTQTKVNFLQILNDIDANKEENCKILMISTSNHAYYQPVLGMTLSTVAIHLTQGFRHHRIHLGFTHGQHNVSKDKIPEVMVVLDQVTKIKVMDWWHPCYPFSDSSMPLLETFYDEDDKPCLLEDFMTSSDFL